MKRVVLSIRTKTINDFDIINWEIAEQHRIWDEYEEEIENICKSAGDYNSNDSFRNDDDRKLNNVGKYIHYYINESNIAYGWRVNSCSYQCVYLSSKDEYKHKFTVEFDSIELAEDPLHMFGLNGETKVNWLKKL